MPMLLSFSGLPGVGKSTIARQLAMETGALWLWADEIEVAMRASHMEIGDLVDGGYAAAQAVANRALMQGYDVIGDCVNPLRITRDGWAHVARNAEAEFHQISLVCSDATEHKKRVESRVVSLDGWQAPTWIEVKQRKFEPFENENEVILDTCKLSVDEAVSILSKQFGRA